MQKIKKLQIKDIYTLGAALGIVEHNSHSDGLHLLVCSITGKEGVSELTEFEAALVIAELKRRFTSAGGCKIRCKATPEYNGSGVTQGQRGKIWASMYQLEKVSPANNAKLGDRLCGIIKRQFGIDASCRDPFRWLSYAQGVQLIEILKGYISSAASKRRCIDIEVEEG